MAVPRLKHYVLTLTGSAQRLSSVLPDTTQGGTDDVPLQLIILQPDGGNGNACQVGDSGITSTLFGFQLAAGAAGVPPAPFQLGSLSKGATRLSDWWVIGTNGQKLHITALVD